MLNRQTDNRQTRRDQKKTSHLNEKDIITRMFYKDSYYSSYSF